MSMLKDGGETMISLDRFAYGTYNNHPEYSDDCSYRCSCCGCGTDRDWDVVYDSYSDKYYCKHCIDLEDVVKCSACGRYIEIDKAEDVDDEYVCTNCAEEM